MSKPLNSYILCAKGDSVDFILENGELISIKRDGIRCSALAQKYALEGTRVIDIRETPIEGRILDTNSFDIYLDTGGKHTVYSLSPYSNYSKLDTKNRIKKYVS